MAVTKTISWGRYRLEFGKRTQIMGILNVTPDSFSDGGLFYRKDEALAHIERMIMDGADIIDIGGESSRPFSDPVSIEDELKRVIPIIESLAPKISIPISIDTTKAEVARQALAAGAAIINDISAFRLDGQMSKIAAQYDVPVILMHMQGTPKTMQKAPAYKNLIEEIVRFLDGRIQEAVRDGVSKSKIIVDPGIGFGKSFQHNLELINGLKRFEAIDAPLLIGPSRKAFIRDLLKSKDQEAPEPMHPHVETGTQAAVAAAVLNGADIVRVHNVSETSVTVKIIDAIKRSDDPKIK